MLLRPITIRPNPSTKREESEMDAEKQSLKQLDAMYQLESEQTISSPGMSHGSQDSGVTSLATSNIELRTAGLKEKVDTLEPLSSSTSPVKEDVQGTC